MVWRELKLNPKEAAISVLDEEKVKIALVFVSFQFAPVDRRSFVCGRAHGESCTLVLPSTLLLRACLM